MSEKHKNVSRTLKHFEQFPIFISAGIKKHASVIIKREKIMLN